MRAKAISAVPAFCAALLGVPAATSAGPPTRTIPESESASMFVRGPHGYSIIFTVNAGRATLVAQRSSRDGGDPALIYSRSVPGPTDGRLHFGLGRAGEVNLHLVTEKVEEEEPTDGCTGDPAIVEGGHFVGRIAFHPPGRFARIDASRAIGGVVHEPSRVCPRRPPGTPHRPRHGKEEVAHRLIAGDADGKRLFEMMALPPFFEDVSNDYFASVTRDEGPLEITAFVSVAPKEKAAPTVPDLGALPATVTVEPPAPFSGSATFDLTSGRSTVEGDLAIELPGVGKVAFTGPEIRSGVCRDFACTKSLPKALRPKRSTAKIVSVSGEGPPEEVPTK